MTTSYCPSVRCNWLGSALEVGLWPGLSSAGISSDANAGEQGPQGDPGPEGPQGEPGLQGEPGPGREIRDQTGPIRARWTGSDRRVIPAHKVILVLRDCRVSMASKVLRGCKAWMVLQDPKVCKVCRVTLVYEGRKVQ